MRKRLDPTKKKVAKNYRPYRRFYRKYTKETIKALEEAQSWDYTKDTNFIRMWGKFRTLTDYPTEIRYVNEMRKKVPNDNYKKRVFLY